MGRAIEMEWMPPAGKGAEVARFNLYLQGFEPGQKVAIEFWEVDAHEDYRDHGETRIGTIAGVVEDDRAGVRQFLRGPSATDSVTVGKDGAAEPVVSVVVDQPGGGTAFAFSPITPGEDDELDSWEVVARLSGDAGVRSPLWYLARHDRRVPESQATYPWHSGHDVEFYNDGSTDASGSGGYFHDLSEAIREARHFIFIADWSFQPLMRLKPTDPLTVGERLATWARADPKRLVAIHTWDHTRAGAKDVQNDDGAKILSDEIGRPGNMLWRASSRSGEAGGSGLGWSHHQKFVVMDCPCPGDAKGRRALRVFIGGLDLTQGRFDWPEHPIEPGDPGCGALLKVTDARHAVHDWYNAEFGRKTPLLDDASAVDTTHKDFHPRQPWHDIHARVTGPGAWDIVREFVGRWNLDPAYPDAAGDDDDQSMKTVLDLFRDQLFDKEKFVPQWEPHKGPWSAQILRSITRDHWGAEDPVKTPAAHKKVRTEFAWTIKNTKFERSIQDAYLRTIRQAERYIYIETQYFIGSGRLWSNDRAAVANEIPEALARQIAVRAAAHKDFHVYLILPMFPEGDPSSSAGQGQRDLQWRSINHLVRRAQDVSGDWRKHLTIGHLANWADLGHAPTSAPNRVARVRNNRRHMIYVHSKLMIVDDLFVILGSANLNERSLNGGRDSEIGVALWPDLTTQKACMDRVLTFRERLWKEHFGGSPPDSAHPENPENGAWMRGVGDANALLLSRARHADIGISRQGHFCTWPIDGSKDGLGLRGKPTLIVDGETGPIVGDDWYLWPTDFALDSFDFIE